MRTCRACASPSAFVRTAIADTSTGRQRVAGAMPDDSRLVMYTLHASSTVMRALSGASRSSPGASFGSPVHDSAFSVRLGDPASLGPVSDAGDLRGNSPPRGLGRVPLRVALTMNFDGARVARSVPRGFAYHPRGRNRPILRREEAKIQAQTGRVAPGEPTSQAK